MSDGERVKKEFISRRMERAELGRYPIVDPAPEDNGRDLEWWLRVLDAKAFLFSMNGSAAWLFPHYELRLAPLQKRVVVERSGVTLVDSKKCFEFRETAHASQIYIPPADVSFGYLSESETVTYCPFKGLASYYSVRIDDLELADAFWTYDGPYDKFPDNGNAADIRELSGMLGLDQRKLAVKLVDDSPLDGA
jgi:uncharacterized protein (DUF427 family)